MSAQRQAPAERVGRARGQVDEVEIPKAVSAGAVALGAVFLVLGRKK